MVSYGAALRQASRSLGDDPSGFKRRSHPSARLQPSSPLAGPFRGGAWAAFSAAYAASAKLASCTTLSRRRLGLHSPRRTKSMMRAAMICLAELSSCKFIASHTLSNAADIALISCASNTLSRKCIPSGKNGMIEAILWTPRFPRPRKAKRRFAAVVPTDFFGYYSTRFVSDRRGGNGASAWDLIQCRPPRWPEGVGPVGPAGRGALMRRRSRRRRRLMPGRRRAPS